MLQSTTTNPYGWNFTGPKHAGHHEPEKRLTKLSHAHVMNVMEIEGYNLLRSLGAGATSEVFEAEKLSESVALKVFAPIISRDPDSLKRLDAEVEALERIRHPNCVQLRRRVQAGDLVALELELVRGSDLRVWNKLCDYSLLEPKYWILVQVARGLGAAHEMGILHRDLKPENILVSEDGQVKVTDFGLARSISRATLTRIGLLIGSLGYMAPEVINQDRPSLRADIFSFGVLAYELLAGISPFHSETPQTLMRSISEGTYLPITQRVPHLPREIGDLIHSCLSVDPMKRPGNIWAIEATLMTQLIESGVLNYCPRLVASAGDRPIGAALEAKHLVLTERLHSLTSKLKENPSLELRESLLETAREMSALFPNDPLAISALTKWLQKPERKNLLWLLSAGAVALGVAIVLAGVLLHSQTRKQEEPHQIPPAAIARVTPLLPDPPVPAIKEAKAAPPIRVKPKPSRGEVRFDVSDDVDVFLDGEMVNKASLEGVKTSIGAHTVKLVKEGFRPIVRSVFVKANESTMVRARGERP